VTIFSTLPQSPSSAETSSPLAAGGQLACFQEAPAADLRTAAGSSFSSAKNDCHSDGTLAGSS